MRHQTLTGFALHQRRYRERSHIVHFFSQENGRVDGVLRQMPPALYHLSSLQANGKSDLKNFSQLDVQGQPFYLQQRALFAGFYLNEMSLKLLPLEVAMPHTFAAYMVALEQLKLLSGDDQHDLQLRLILRRYEYQLLDELGYAIDFFHDKQGLSLDPDSSYTFALQEGFSQQLATSDAQGWMGADLMVLGEALQDHQSVLFQAFDQPFSTSHEQASAQHIALEQQLKMLGQLYRPIIDQLLGHKPLKSRQLWQSQQRMVTQPASS